MARDELAGDCLVWNGDTLVSDALMARVVGNEAAGICVTIDRKPEYDEDDMKVIEGDGRLQAIGKRIREGVNAESIGLLAFRSGGAERFRAAIEQAMRSTEGTTIWYLRVIDGLARTSGDVRVLDISGEEWGEVDFPQDVAAAGALCERWDAGEQ
jgi:choline kinase